jgi:hypothetical protein
LTLEFSALSFTACLKPPSAPGSVSLLGIKKAEPHYSNAPAVFKENSHPSVPAMPQGHIYLNRYQGVNIFLIVD